jgi:hypothetical protein
MIRKFMQCVAVALCCLPAVSIAASGDPQELERQLAKIRSEPMIFVVATGEPNACGRGCTEWIPGEGRFDEGAAQRFREFLAVLAKRDLPIFFSSDGGLVREAVQIGLILRENRMTAGVARTVAEGCHLGFPLDDACRHLMQSKREHKARLYSGGARCASACVYVMVAPRHAVWTQAPRFEFIPAWAAKSTRPRILCGATSWAWASTRPLLMPPLRFPLAPSGG